MCVESETNAREIASISISIDVSHGKYDNSALCFISQLPSLASPNNVNGYSISQSIFFVWKLLSRKNWWNYKLMKIIGKTVPMKLVLVALLLFPFQYCDIVWCIEAFSEYLYEKVVFGPTTHIKLYNLPNFSPKFTSNSQTNYTKMLARNSSIDFDKYFI